MRRREVVGILALAPAVLAFAPPAGHDRHGAPPSGTERITLTIPDVQVLDQDNRPRRFHTDLVRDKVVAVNFMYTTCATACPLLGIAFAGVQQLVGDRVGRDVHLISITVDPAVDTPARMKAWGDRYGARPGWTLVTGARPVILRLLRALGAAAGQKEDHPTFVLIGDDRRGEWTRAWGLLPAADLVPVIEGVLGARAPAASRTH